MPNGGKMSTAMASGWESSHCGIGGREILEENTAIPATYNIIFILKKHQYSTPEISMINHLNVKDSSQNPAIPATYNINLVDTDPVMKSQSPAINYKNLILISSLLFPASIPGQIGNLLDKHAGP